MTHFINSLWVIVCEMSPYVLLGFIFAGLLHVFVRQRTMSRHLSGPGFRPVVKAALFGIPLPLCSCGVLPTAVSLRRRGASKGATTSFLIATPQTGVDSIAATYSLLGLPFAVIRPVAALAGAVFGGAAVSRLCGEDSEVAVSDSADDGEERRPLWRRLVEALRYGLVDMVASVGPWLVVGLIVAAAITVFVPDSFFTSLNRYPILAMLAVVAVAVPMYVCATGSIPIALSLMLKGLSPGTAFVLLMAGPAANFASLVILGRTQGAKATAIYVASVVVTAIGFGLLIDAFLPASWFVPAGALATAGDTCHAHVGWFAASCSVLLAALLVYTSITHRHHHHKIEEMTKDYKIKGMACVHCKANVEKSLAKVPGVTAVEVDLGSAVAHVSGDAAPDDIIEAIRLAGYEFVG